MADEADRWISFGVLPLRQRMGLNLMVTIPGFTLVLILGLQFVVQIVFRSSGWIGFVIAVVAVFILWLIVLILYAHLRPAPKVNFESKQLRVGNRTVALADVDNAVLVVLDKRDRRLLALNFGKTKGLRAIVYLRGPRGVTLSEDDQRVLIRLLEQTSIAMPTTPDDPTGRFARYNFPGHLDREAAIEVVKDPPDIGDPLPVSY